MLTSSLLLLSGILSPAFVAAGTKPYSDGATPESIGAGASVAGTFSITNENRSQTLGSANITPPADMTVTGATSDVGTLKVSGGVIELRDLDLAYPDSVTVSFTLTAPCGASSGQWSTDVKQSNAFNGPPGNGFTNVGSDPTTAVVGSCSLAFVAEPTDATVTTTITSVALDPSGSPVTVAALAGDGSPVDGVSIGLTASPAVAISGSGATTGPGGAPAAFGGLGIATVGSYTLTASAAGFGSATSTSFTVANVGCAPATDCTTSSSAGNTTSSVSTNGGTDGGYILLTLSKDYDGSCAGYSGLSQQSDVDVTTGQPSTAVIQIDKALSGHRGVASFQVCFASTIGFWDRDGAWVAPGSFGLLPDCPNPDATAGAPCILSRNRSPQAKSDVLITFIFPAADPKYFS
ncbi:MAG TPA: carboxypeptidase-like regulatory domain-containing protein [Candidatus Limnocylindrales bacterium]|nr:carboxypeptidase-like regulatory domain-containing protein [Candidatus Limnocylindrales bacterium]